MCFKQIITLFLIKKNRIYPFAKISPNKECIWGIFHFYNFFPQPRSNFLHYMVFTPNLATLSYTVTLVTANSVARKVGKKVAKFY